MTYPSHISEEQWELIKEHFDTGNYGKSRISQGRGSRPSYSLIDSQRVKTTSNADDRGIDGEKKIKGRKRHIVTDTAGNLLHVKVHSANIP